VNEKKSYHNILQVLKALKLLVHNAFGLHNSTRTDEHADVLCKLHHVNAAVRTEKTYMESSTD
jgi:hypothetical protein